MKVAVSSTGRSLDAGVDPRFGRCPYFVVVETETMGYEVVPNAAVDAPSGAGIQAAQLVAGRGVETVLTGRVGPNAAAVLSQAGVKVVTGAQGTVRQAIEAFMGGRLEAAPAVGYGWGGVYGGRGGRGMGMGRGMGGGRGRRMGGGMGPGGGRGAYAYPSQPMAGRPTGSTTREDEREALTRELEQLERRLREVRRRLEELRR